MNTKKLLIQLYLLSALLLALDARAQSNVVFTSLHSFGIYTNGAYPSGTLVQGSDGNFYGTTSGGGTNGGYGTVFEVATNGALTLLHTFTGGNDGTSPYAGLVQGSDGNFYGTARFGGVYGNGTVFKISANGAFTSFYSFTGGKGGGDPIAGLVQGSDGYFYGTTDGGGTNGYGTVFKISTNGAFISLYSFTGSNDGAGLIAGLVQGSDGNFYGTTEYGGSGVGYNGHGTVFKISANGAFTSLYSFTNGNGGGNPAAGLVQGSDDNFYGTTAFGGTNGGGTVFKISSNGTFASLNSFTGGNGWFPGAGLVQGSDGDFYGTTTYGGPNGSGTIFKIGESGALTTLYSFTGGNDGAGPQALVQGSDGNFYGTAENGGTIAGSYGLGTLFKISASGAFTGLYSFPGLNDGGNPEAGLIQGNDGNFYSTTSQGGTNGFGTVFKIGADGTLTTLYSFTGGNDGGYPQAGLVQGNDGNFYGTTSQGGTNGWGTVFKISASGVLTSLYSFTGGNDGGNLEAGLVQGNDGNFYGTTEYGGTNYSGTVFKISASGALTSLYSFTGGNDGGEPFAGLAQGSDGYFYGTTQQGGTNGGGTVFKISAGGAFTSLYSFTGGNDGWDPEAGLVQGSDGNFYGTTFSGGTNEAGVVFNISANGTFTSLYSFTGFNDGENPQAGLIQGSDGNFYGTTEYGGTNGDGTVFEISATGVLTPLYSFTGSGGGENPQADLVQGFDGNFYGTTSQGGIGGNGTVFSLSTGLTGSTIVRFTASATGGTPPLTVQFKSPDVDVLGNPIISWSWNFGDGATSALQNPSHTYTTVSAFAPALIATNNQGVEVIGIGPQIIVSPTNLIQNDGFETGNFTDWTTNGNFGFCFVTTDPTYVHSGSYGAELGPGGSLGYLSQTLTTVPGQSYSISLWLNSPDGLTPNEFLVSWNGETLFDQTDFPAIGWTNLQFTVTATSASTSLEFGFRDDLGYLGLDDVSVVPVSSAAIGFTATPTNGQTPLAVQFNSPSVDSLGNAITSWNWNFGSGTTSAQQDPSHTYTTAGTFTPTLIATDVDDIVVTAYGPQVVVTAPILSATIQFTASTTNGVTPLPVQFSSPGVDSLGNAIVSWNWNFGDGATSTVQDPPHTYTTAGTFTPTLIATDVDDIVVTGYGPQVTVTLPGSSGNPQSPFLWSEYIASIANTWPDGEPDTGLALDTNDNCYVTGWFDNTNNFGGVTLVNQSTGGGSDIFVAKYNSKGALQWVQQAGGTAGNPNNGRGIGLDTNGNVYVDGGYYDSANFGGFELPSPSSGNEGTFLAKYNNAGAIQWVKSAVGVYGNLYGIGLTVDSAGNSYALDFDDSDAGSTVTFGSVNVPIPADYSESAILVKYDNNGSPKWAVLMGGSGEVYATKVAVDAAGNLYVRGTFFSTLTIGSTTLTVSADSSKNAFLAKFNSSGGLVWVQQPTGGNVDEGGVAVDQAGNVYTSGGFENTLNFGNGIALTNLAPNTLFGDGFVAKYNSVGAIQWAEEAGGTNGAFYWDVALDGQDNVYPAGFYGIDAAVAKYNSNGTPQWTYTASGLPASPVSSLVGKCAVDSAGNCYAAGWYQGATSFGTNTLQPQETWNFFLTEVASSTSAQVQYTYAPEVQSTPSASLTYNSVTGTFQYTDGVGLSGYAYLPLLGNATSFITTSNGWTASLVVNLTPTTLTNNGAGGTPAIDMALAVFSGSFSQDRLLFTLEQVNNTAGTDLSDYADGFYGIAAKFAALSNGNSDVTTRLGGSQSGSEGDSYLVLSGGTDDSPTTESIGNADGVLTLTYNNSARTVTGSYNGTPVGSYSLASWGTNPPLTLVVFGASNGANVGVPAGTDTASDFFVSSSTPNPAIRIADAGFGMQNDQFGFNITGGNGSIVVVEASTNLANPIWIPVSTNTLTGGSSYFSDPQWMNYLGRFYRVSTP